MPLQLTTSLGDDAGAVMRFLVSPEVDAVRLEKLWNLDLRLAKQFTMGRFNANINADLFNVFNENVILNRIRNVASTTFFQPTQNLSPRIFRIGMRIGF